MRCHLLSGKGCNMVFCPISEGHKQNLAWCHSESTTFITNEEQVRVTHLIVTMCWVSLFLQITSDRMRRNDLKYCQGRFMLYEDKFLHWEGGQALEQAALGSGGILIPVSVHKVWGNCTWGHSILVNRVNSWTRWS